MRWKKRIGKLCALSLLSTVSVFTYPSLLLVSNSRLHFSRVCGKPLTGINIANAKSMKDVTENVTPLLKSLAKVNLRTVHIFIRDATAIVLCPSDLFLYVLAGRFVAATPSTRRWSNSWTSFVRTHWPWVQVQGTDLLLILELAMLPMATYGECPEQSFPFVEFCSQQSHVCLQSPASLHDAILWTQDWRQQLGSLGPSHRGISLRLAEAT